MTEGVLAVTFECASASYYKATVTVGKKSHEVVYDGRWHCDCATFRRRGACAHIQEAMEGWCGWRQQRDGGEPVGGRCPLCGDRAKTRITTARKEP